MGTFGKAEVEIQFNKGVPKQFKNVETLIEVLKEHQLGYYSIYNYNVGDDAIVFEMTSDRIQNLDWQVNSLSDFLRCHFNDDVVEFLSSGYVASDYGSLNWSDYE
jgi:hypothetical protein